MKRRSGLALVAGLVGIPSLILGTAASHAPAGTNQAEAQGLELGLHLELGGQEIISESGSLAATQAGPEPGTDNAELAEVPIPELLWAQLISSESTVYEDGSEAEAEVVGLALTLTEAVSLAEASVASSEVTCPADGPTTADAQLVDLQLLEQNLDLQTNEDPIEVTLPVDLDLGDDVIVAQVYVEASQTATTTADSAHAIALELLVSVDATIAGQPVAGVEVGRIVLAESHCARATDAGDGDGTGDNGDGTGDNGDGTGDNGDDGDGTGDNGDNGDTVLPSLPGDDVDDADGPSADALDPDRGPASGGTEVIVDGNDLDQVTDVAIDGTPVDFDVSMDGQQLTFVTPGGDPGTVDVVVTFEDGSSDTLPFTYDAHADADADADATGDRVLPAATGDTTGVSATGLPATGATSATALAFALLLLTGGMWLLTWRSTRPVLAGG